MNLSTADLFKTSLASDAQTLTPSDLARLKLALLEIASDIISFCDEHGLCYMLGGGSALGAIRHQGFIPWDDDFDLLMPRTDYDRFIELFPKELGNKYWVRDPRHTPSYELLFCQVRKKGTIVRTREDLGVAEAGACVDVFPLERTYDNGIRRNWHGFISLAFGFALSCRKFRANRNQMMALAMGDKTIERTFRLKIRLGWIFSFLPVASWVRKADAWNSRCNDSSSKFVALPTGRKHFFGELAQKDRYLPTGEAVFEGYRWQVPQDVDAYLRALYGDYMILPKEEDRETHLIYEFDLGDA